MLWHGKNFRGIINKAKQMIFDNTGTDLISTNAEDAIKEVNSKLSIHDYTTLSDVVSTTGITDLATPSIRYCRKQGKTVYLSFAFKNNNTNKSSGITDYFSGTLLPAFIPKGSVDLACCSGTTILKAHIDGDSDGASAGKIYLRVLYGTWNANYAGIFSITYPTS